MSGHASWWDRALLLAAIEGIAVSLWLTAASVHIVRWESAAPVRLALLLPSWELLLALAVGVVVVGLLQIVNRVKEARDVLAPAALLWVLAVPYLPWLADRLPLLLVLAGPLRWVIVALVVVKVFLQWQPARASGAWRYTVGRRTVFATSLAVYLVFGLWAVTKNGLGGDEPHYLVITESLLKDQDLQIDNNHRRGDYRSFFPGELRPDFMERGTNGEIYSIHAPGLSALVLPVYAVFGHLGAAAFIALLAALTALAIFDLAMLLAGEQAAVLTWLAVCLTVPFVPHAWAIFPEMPGALLVAWGFLWLFQPVEQVSSARWLTRGVALAALPWLHTKFIVFLAILSVGFGLKLLRRPGHLAALGTPIAASAAGWLVFFYVIYGRSDPEAPYGAYTSLYVLTSNIPHGLLGLFFDQKFGLLFYAPIYALVPMGMWLLARDREHRLGAFILVLTIAAYVASTARLYMFWGGSSAPARFFVPLLPAIAPLIAVAIARWQTTAARTLVAISILVGLSIAFTGIVFPEQFMLFSDPHGRARLLESIQAGSPLALVMPTFTEPDWRSQIPQLLQWIGAALVALVALFAAARSGARWMDVWSLGLLTCAMFLVAGAVLTARPPAVIRAATANRGALEVLWRFDGARFRTFDYERFARAAPDRFRDLTTLTTTLRLPDSQDAPAESPYLNLPPGLFDVSVWFTGTGGREGEVAVRGPGAVFGRVAGVLANPTTFVVDMPAAARRVTAQVANRQVARSVSQIRFVPRDIVPPNERLDRVRAVESIPGPHAGYLVYTDGEAYPEQGTFWSRGTARTSLFIVPRGASQAVLTLSTGPMAGLVTVEVAGRVQHVSMPGNADVSLTMALPPGARFVPLAIQSSTMFRPSEVDPAANDTRGLGCQVRLALE